MENKKPQTLDEAWGIIQEQAKLIELLQQRIEQLEKEIDNLKKGQSKGPPSFVKESNQKRRKKKRGPKLGHNFWGFLRSKREVDETKEWFLGECPDCGGKVSPSVEKTQRYEIDIPPVEPIVRCHVIGRHWCGNCKRLVSASIPGLLPNTPFSQNIHLQTAHFKYGLGLSLEKIQALFYEVYSLNIASGTLSEMLSRLGDRMESAYDLLHEGIHSAQVLNGDETGWRVDGVNHWLWSFSCSAFVYYHIDKSRGQNVVSTILGESFAGVLVSDFYNAYNLICALKQKCWVHVLRDIKKIEKEYIKDEIALSFAKKLKRQIKRALSLKAKQADLEISAFKKRAQVVKVAIQNALEATSNHPAVRRLSKRLLKYHNELFLFLEYEGVPAHNNDAERQIRPAVLMRKISYQNASQRGAKTQAILMSVIQTCRKRKLSFFEWGRRYLDATDPPKDIFSPVI